MYHVTWTANQPDRDTDKIIEKVNTIFDRIMGRFGTWAFREALTELKDSRFPVKPDESNSRKTPEELKEHYEKHYKVFSLTEDGKITQAYPPVEESSSPIEIKKEVLELLLNNPEAGLEKAALQNQLNLELQKETLDERKARDIIIRAKSMPGNFAEALLKEAIQSLSQGMPGYTEKLEFLIGFAHVDYPEANFIGSSKT